MTDTRHPLPAAWSAPVADRLSRLVRELQAAATPAAVEAAWMQALQDAASLPVDPAPLAAWMEEALGAHAAAGLADSALARASTTTTALAADPVALGVEMAPFEQAVERMQSRTPVASLARTAQWAQVPSMLRQRAFFSAGVESANFLERTRKLLEMRAGLEQMRLGNGKAVWMDRDNFIDAARKIANESGLPAADGRAFGTLRDIRSLPRLKLIYEVQNEQAAEYARRKADMAPEALDAYPAFALIRVESRAVPRGEPFWNDRWRQAGSSVGWRGASRNGRAALKTSAIWQALGNLGPFGTPYPPFDWGSGMGLSDISRAEAETLGLLRPGQPMPPGEEPPGLTQDLQARVDVDPAIAARMKAWFGDQVEINGGVARWRG